MYVTGEEYILDTRVQLYTDLLFILYRVFGRVVGDRPMNSLSDFGVLCALKITYHINLVMLQCHLDWEY